MIHIYIMIGSNDPVIATSEHTNTYNASRAITTAQSDGEAMVFTLLSGAKFVLSAYQMQRAVFIVKEA